MDMARKDTSQLLFGLVHSAQPVLELNVVGSANHIDFSSRGVSVLFMMQLLGRLQLHRQGKFAVLVLVGLAF